MDVKKIEKKTPTRKSENAVVFEKGDVTLVIRRKELLPYYKPILEKLNAIACGDN